MDELVEAALRDGVVQSHEIKMLNAVGTALGLDTTYVPDRIEGRTVSSSAIALEPEMTVCFTGSATTEDGAELSRSLLQRLAEDLDLVPVDRLTKKTSLLVAADPSSQSGKAKKAREYGIPLAAVHDFLLAQPRGTLPVA